MNSGLNVESLKLFASEQRLSGHVFSGWYELVPSSQHELKTTLRDIWRGKHHYEQILSRRLQLYGDPAEIPGRTASHQRELRRRLDELKRISPDTHGLFELTCNRGPITSAPSVNELLNHVDQADPILTKILELIKLQDERDVFQLRILCGVD